MQPCVQKFSCGLAVWTTQVPADCGIIQHRMSVQTVFKILALHPSFFDTAAASASLASKSFLPGSASAATLTSNTLQLVGTCAEPDMLRRSRHKAWRSMQLTDATAKKADLLRLALRPWRSLLSG